MNAIFQMTLANVYSWMEMYEFLSWFQWNLFLHVQLTLFQHWFRQWLASGQATSHWLNQWWLVYWCIYVSLGFSESKAFMDHSGQEELLTLHGSGELQLFLSIFYPFTPKIDTSNWLSPSQPKMMMAPYETIRWSHIVKMIQQAWGSTYSMN